jgi:hypothetical protein
MKPKNDKPFCPDCGRPKMLFETERKAQNFIKYNGQDILRDGQTIDQIRVYYCPSCCGYHITTKPFKESYNHRTENLIKAYKKSKANKAVLNLLNFTDDEVIKAITEEARKALICSKNQMKLFLTDYFAKHTEFSKCQQDNIRHKIYQIIGKTPTLCKCP